MPLPEGAQNFESDFSSPFCSYSVHTNLRFKTKPLEIPPTLGLTHRCAKKGASDFKDSLLKEDLGRSTELNDITDQCFQQLRKSLDTLYLAFKFARCLLKQKLLEMPSCEKN
jgi:hypothetical protein